MRYKILKADGKFFCQTTMQYFTLEECADPEHKNLRDDFDTHVTNWLGDAATIKYFDTSDLTPECVYYEDPYSIIQEGPPDEVLPMPELGGRYVNVEIMLLRGYEMAIGQVTKQAHYIYGNPLGNANDNPIINTCQYIVEVADGDEAKLASNVIASNMYAQCDPNGNQYVLIDYIIDFCRSTTSL